MRINSITTPYNYPKTPSMKGKYTPKKCVSAPLVAAPLIKLSPVLSTILTHVGIFLLSFLGTSLYSKFSIKRHKKPVKLEPEIEYKEAKNIEEAKAFAKKNFKIKKFKVNDLSVANYVNEGLTILSNKFKGDVYMPSKITYKRCDNDDVGGKYAPAHDCLKLNKVSQNYLDKKLELRSNYVYDPLFKNYPIITNSEELVNILNNKDKLSPVEKWSISSDIAKMLGIVVTTNKTPVVLNEMLKSSGEDLFGPVYLGRFGTLFHEMGHIFDMKSSNDNKKTRKIKEQIFQKGKQDLILPKYAKSNYSEFVAETFAGIMNGAKYPKPIMDLFNSLTNIKIPKD